MDVIKLIGAVRAFHYKPHTNHKYQWKDAEYIIIIIIIVVRVIVIY